MSRALVTPTPRLSPNRVFVTVFQSYGLVVALAAILIVFGALKPDTYLSVGNVQNLLTTTTVTLLAAFAVMVPLATNEFNLSVGYHIGLAHVLVIGMQERFHTPWPLTIVVIVVMGGAVGALNGVLVARFGISSFIATLGTGMLLFGCTNMFSDGQQIVATDLPESFTTISSNLGVVPVPAIIAAVIAVLLYVLLERTVFGRSLYVIGASRRAAELTGVDVPSKTIGAFVISGLVASCAGIILGANLRAGTPSVGPEFLLPAFSGALLGATAIRPGRVNVVGTILAVLTLAFLFAGLQQFGAPFYVEYFFNGAILIVAVGLSVYAAARNRARALAPSRADSPERGKAEPDAPEPSRVPGAEYSPVKEHQ